MPAHPVELQRQIEAALLQEFEFEEDAGKSAVRHAYIAEVMANGGRGFVDRVRKYGATDSGEPLRLRLWLRLFWLWEVVLLVVAIG
jgi:hypothetical protein